METTQSDQIHAMMVDGNAAAGILYEIFAHEMTSSWIECASCGKEGEIGTLFAFIQAPGIVLRCPVCENIVLRISQTPDSIYIDIRGAVFLRLKRSGISA